MDKKKKTAKAIMPYGVVNGILVDLDDILTRSITQCRCEMAYKGTDGRIIVIDWYGGDKAVLFPDTIFRKLCNEANESELAINTIYRILSLPGKILDELKK